MRPLHGCVLAVLGAAAGLTVYRFTLGAASDVPSVATASALEVLGHAPPRAATADPSRDRCIAAYGARVSAVLPNATTTVERMLARMRTQPSATSDHPLVVLASPGSTGTRSVFKAMCVLRLKGIHYMTHCNSDQPDCAFQPLYSRTVTGANKRGRHPPDWVENGVERLFDAWGDLAVARREGTCDRWLEARGNVPFFDGPEEYWRVLERFDFVADSPFVQFTWDILARYPRAKLIFTDRPGAEWVSKRGGKCRAQDKMRKDGRGGSFMPEMRANMRQWQKNTQGSSWCDSLLPYPCDPDLATAGVTDRGQEELFHAYHSLLECVVPASRRVTVSLFGHNASEPWGALARTFDKPDLSGESPFPVLTESKKSPMVPTLCEDIADRAGGVSVGV